MVVETINLGLDPQHLSAAAHAFVDSVVSSRWVYSESPTGTGQPDRRLARLTPALRELTRALNPDRVPFDELDRMGWLARYGTDPISALGYQNPLRPYITLAAAFGWVVRFWSAQPLCETDTWTPVFPFEFLPFNLVATIWESGAAVRDGGPPSRGYRYPKRAKVEQVPLSESAEPATGILHNLREIRENLAGFPSPDVLDDNALFRLLSNVEWHTRRLPASGYEACYERAWSDGGVTARCALEGVSSLWPRLNVSLGWHAVHTRSPELSNLLKSSPWAMPFWTPEARCGGAACVPDLNIGLWVNQVQIEAGKLGQLQQCKREVAPTKGKRKTSLNERELAVQAALDRACGFQTTAKKWPLARHDQVRAVRVAAIVKACGCSSTSFVGETEAWAAFEARRAALGLSPRKQGGRRKAAERPLTSNMLKAIPAEPVPVSREELLPDEDESESLKFNEELRQLYEESDAKGKAAINNLTPTERKRWGRALASDLGDADDPNTGER